MTGPCGRKGIFMGPPCTRLSGSDSPLSLRHSEPLPPPPAPSVPIVHQAKKVVPR